MDSLESLRDGLSGQRVVADRMISCLPEDIRAQVESTPAGRSLLDNLIRIMANEVYALQCRVESLELESSKGLVARMFGKKFNHHQGR